MTIGYILKFRFGYSSVSKLVIHVLLVHNRLASLPESILSNHLGLSSCHGFCCHPNYFIILDLMHFIGLGTFAILIGEAITFGIRTGHKKGNNESCFKK